MANYTLDETRNIKVLLNQVRAFRDTIQGIIDNKESSEHSRYVSFYDRETGKFEFSGKEFIPDFIIPKLQLCLEIKLLREGKKSKIIEEISADITAYGKQYERQLYIVYDLGCIQNEEEFKRDIENTGNVKVIIVKH